MAMVNDQMFEPIHQSSTDFSFSGEVLDALTGILLQLCEEVDEYSFSKLVIEILQAFDGDRTIDPVTEFDFTETLVRVRNIIGLNSYCLLRGLLAHHTVKKEKTKEWFNLIALNSFSGHEYRIYQLITGYETN